ncbi:MAG: DegV family protein [Bacillota bacterium]|nr:DegV family protein [Bacillota bacterium]
MSKIKLIADASCDIELDVAKDCGIEIVPMNVIHNGKSYLSEVEISKDRVYDLVDECPELMSTSQPTPEQFINSFRHAVRGGYDTLIVSTINAAHSGTYQSACIAKELFLEENNKVRIEVIDSYSYSYLFGNMVMRMKEMIDAEKTVNEILEYAYDYRERIEAFAALGTLDHLKRMGRVSGAASFIGGLLNIKPVIYVHNKNVEAHSKIRGKKNVMEQLIKLAGEVMDPDSEIMVLGCRNHDEMIEFSARIKEILGKEVRIRCSVGCVLCINTGTNLLGLGFLRKKQN